MKCNKYELTVVYLDPRGQFHMHYIIFTKLCWWLVNLAACLVILISSFFFPIIPLHTAWSKQFVVAMER